MMRYSPDNISEAPKCALLKDEVGVITISSTQPDVVLLKIWTAPALLAEKPGEPIAI